MSRKELYDKVKEYGLQEVILKKYGKNFTQCSNSALESEVSAVAKRAIAKSPTPTKKEVEKKVEEKVEKPTPKMVGTVESKFAKLVEILGKKRILLASEIDAIAHA